MGILEYVLLILIVACLLGISYISMYNRFQINVIRINEAEANIDAALRKRFENNDSFYKG